MEQLDELLMLLNPNKPLADIKLKSGEFDKKPLGYLSKEKEAKLKTDSELPSVQSPDGSSKVANTDTKPDTKADTKPEEKPKSRKERRLIERQEAKKTKGKKPDTRKQELTSNLEKLKEATRLEIGNRLAPIIFGVNYSDK